MATRYFGENPNDMPTRQLGWKLRTKRAFDVVGSIVLLFVAAPIMMLVAAAILISDGSPVLYQWRVVGQSGKPFLSWKFRTMVRNADKLKSELMRHNEMRGPAFKMKDDPRITKIGR